MSDLTIDHADLQRRLRDPLLHEEVRQHAFAIYPDECCGILTERGYKRLTNVAEDARHTFDCSAELAPYLINGEVLAFIHSHPDGPHAPSAFDMKQQAAMNVPWGLISTTVDGYVPLFFWGDMLDPPPLEGRPFRYGPSGTDGRGDCAALVRDWFWTQRQIRLPEFPREFRWWRKPNVSYHANLLSAGFKDINGEELREGDVFLARVGEHQQNHAGIYLGNGLILHHLENRLSREEPSVIYKAFIQGWYRHAGLA